MADLPAKQSVFTRVRNSILNAGISNNFTRNIIANFAPNMMKNYIANGAIIQTDKAKLFDSLTLEQKERYFSDFVPIFSAHNSEISLDEILEKIPSERRLEQYNKILGIYESQYSTFYHHHILERCLMKLPEERRKLVTDKTFEYLKDDSNVIIEIMRTLSLEEQQKYYKKEFEYFKNDVNKTIGFIRVLNKNLHPDIVDDIFEALGKLDLDYQPDREKMFETVGALDSEARNMKMWHVLNENNVNDADFAVVLQLLSMNRYSRDGKIKDELYSFIEKNGLQLLTEERIQEFQKMSRERGSVYIKAITYDSMNMEYNRLVNEFLNNRNNASYIHVLQTISNLYTNLSLDAETRTHLKQCRQNKYMDLFSLLNDKEKSDLSIYTLDKICEEEPDYIVEQEEQLDRVSKIVNETNPKTIELAQHAISGMSRDYNNNFTNKNYGILKQFDFQTRNTVLIDVLNGDITDSRFGMIIDFINIPEAREEFIRFSVENDMHLTLQEKLDDIPKTLSNNQVKNLANFLSQIECRQFISKYDNKSDERFLDIVNKISGTYDKYSKYGMSKEEIIKGKINNYKALFSKIPPENRNRLFQLAIESPKNFEFLTDVLSECSLEELGKIFSKNISLPKEKIVELITTKKEIAMKLLFLDGDIDREKLTSLVTYNQLKKGSAIDLNSVISKLYMNNIGKDKTFLIHDLNSIYNLFTYNNIPEFLKTFRLFQLGNFYNADNKSIQSFEGKTTEERDTLILEDLFKISLDSNSESLREFAEVITEGKRLTTLLQSNPEKKIETLSVEERALLEQYRDTLFDLHNITTEVRDTGRQRIEKTDNVIGDLRTLISVYSDNKDHNVDSKNIVFNPNKIMDELFKGFVTTTIRPRAMLEYMDKVKENADARHLQIEDQLKSGKMHLQEGDFIKGIQNFDDYIPSMLRDGIKGGEFNQEHSHSDATPLDADFGYISSKNITGEETYDYNIILTTVSGNYGQNYVVLKQYTEKLGDRQEDLFDQGHFSGSTDFYALGNETSAESRYIRTGIPITDVDYIVSKDWNPKNGYEMAMAGMYIPVIDSKGEVVFSSEDYKKIREEMRGLSRYHAEDIIVSDKARNMEALYETYRKVSTKSAEETEKEIESVKALVEGKEDETTSKKKKATTDFIKGYFESKGIRVVDDLSQNLSTNSVELIDTGSTGRGTNVPGDGDFDFMLRHNLPDDVLEELTQKVGEITPKEDFAIVSDGFRSKGAVLPSGEVVDIDVTTAKKDLALSYSSDMCVRDRLDNIRTHTPADYNYVQANIIMAKKILKAEGVYKKAGSTGATKYGGFGGIGVENWVLQNGGSFEQALDTFMDTANQVVDYNDFKRKYPIFDFGFNHREGKTRHDRFSAFLGVDGQYPIGFNYVKEIFPTLQQTMTLENEKQSERENGIEPESPLMQSISAKGFAEAGKNKSGLRNKFNFSQVRGLVAKYMSMQSVQQETRNTNNSLEEKDD